MIVIHILIDFNLLRKGILELPEPSPCAPRPSARGHGSVEELFLKSRMLGAALRLQDFHKHHFLCEKLANLSFIVPVLGIGFLGDILGVVRVCGIPSGSKRHTRRYEEAKVTLLQDYQGHNTPMK